jgi:hypothetical protein
MEQTTGEQYHRITQHKGMTMKYKNTQTGEIWTDASTSTSRTSNFYLFTHNEKVGAGWELVEETPSVPVVESLNILKANKIWGAKSMASKIILDKYPVYKQINASLGLYSAEETQEIKQFIASVISIVDQCEQQVELATTSEELEFEVHFNGSY